MASCKDCINYKICSNEDKSKDRTIVSVATWDFVEDVESRCSYFNDRSRFVEQPCKCGQCRNYKLRNGSYWCVLHMVRMHSDDYCSYGVLRSVSANA